MGKLWRALNHLGIALVVFVAIAGVFLWSTGTLRIRVPGQATHSKDDGHGHEAQEAAHPDEHAGHDHGADWCDEHGVPESACTRCNPALVAQFKADGDWCAEHALPESHCEACNPGARAALEAACEGEQDELAALETRQCEHGKPILSCDDCRYQVGVVKVEPAVAKALLRTDKVERREAVRMLRMTGEVQLDRTRVVDVPPTASGRIVTVNALLGQKVERDAVLAVVHSADFGEAKAAYLTAHTEFEIARKEQERQANLTAALDKLLEHLAKVNGDANHKKAGHYSPEIPKQLVGEWKSKLLGAAARMRLAEMNHEREKGLWEKGISSKAEHDEAHQEWEAAQADYAALVEEVHLNLSLDKLRADNAARKAEAALHAAQQRLHIFGLSHEDVRALRERKDNGDFALLPVKAPRQGTITAQNASEGRFVETTDRLYTIADLSNVWVWCDAYERDLAALHALLSRHETVPAAVKVAAFPDTAFAGTIDLVGNTMDEHTRTVKVRLQVANPEGRLKPGMFATVYVEVPSGKEVALVPREAVLSDDGEPFVFQHWKDDFWVRRDVTVGEGAGRQVAILDGLADGATVVTGGGFMLKGDVLRNKMGAG
ncbi:MAG: efflux RND transporter periplasmic adaptor subunit [Planctomycetota bacterium]